MTSALTKNCEMTPTGCFSTKAFNTATIKYSVAKNGIKLLSGDGNVCEIMESADSDAKAVLSMLALPEKCPVKAGEICVDKTKKISFKKHKNLLPMMKGKIQVNATITHDTVCFEYFIVFF